jgi:hypothetical protein
MQAGVSRRSLLSIYINDIPSVQNVSNVAISAYADNTDISVQSGSIRYNSWEVKRCCSPFRSVVPEVENKDYYREMHNYSLFHAPATLSPQTVSSNDF